MRGIRQPALFELRARCVRLPRLAACKGWRNAVDLHHLPGGTHSLAPRPGSLDRLTFQIGPRGRFRTCTIEGLSFEPLHWATRGGAHGRICTGTSRVLRALSLRWTTWANWCRVKDSHPQPPRSERGASAVGLTRQDGCDLRIANKLALPEGLSPSSPTFEASRSGN